ncbi:unnamed protein product [Trypanosoma congolense IL3000]|uniref:WGS project CAEQ00000000 data, annotated contig 1837 n=1 Tax=Trypanosoma congolense (strain IL3000) TaxID=1068625 RepID=F9W991_TRYCI|nr:unnamed protein product [Trypanosoma congolense IL3000]
MYRTTHPPPKGRKQKHQWAGSHGPLAATPQFASLPPISGGRQSLVGRDMAHASARSMSRSSRRESGVMSASRRTLSPLQSTSPDTVLKMNVKAMELLGKENMDASEKKMQAALQLAETGVQNFRQNLSLNDNEDSRKMLESWLLALAVTLSNYGSLRRRMNQPQEALMYMERAQDAEKEVFGEPSCATLLNMSAVMLALGMFDEALNVARDCAAASEGRDPMLHAVALHNYGVALRSHPTSGANESAAPILMKALREAESKLGVHHPTTVIIRQRCGMAATGSRSGRTDGSRGRSTKKKGGSTTSLNKSTNSSRASPSKSVKRSTPSVCNERASTGRKRKSVSRGSPSSRPTEGSPDIRDRVKRAIKRLDYGEVDTMYTESCTLSANDNELGQTECSKQPSECSGSPAPLSVLPTSRETSLLNEVVAAPRQDSPSVTRSGPCSPTIVKLPAVDLSRGWSPPRSKCMTATIVCRNPVAGGANPTGTPPDACSSDVPEIRETCPPRGAPCHVVEGLDSTQVKEEPTDKNNEPRPSRTTGHLAGSRSHGSTQQEANARGSRSINSKKSLNSAFLSGYIDLTCDLSKDGPSFIHYADIEAFALPAVKQMSHLTTPRDLVHSNAADERARCREEKRRKRCLLGLDSSDDVDLYLGEEEEEDEDEDEEEGKKCEGSPERSPEMHGGRDMLEKAKEGDAAKGKKMIVTKIIGVSPAVRRLQRIKKEQEEEEKMRTRLRKEAEELAQKQYFEGNTLGNLAPH